MTESGAPGEPDCCPDCGAALSSARLFGLCPACLLGHPPAGTALPGEPAPRSGPALMQLSGHRLTRELARGGMGIVYEATQLSPERTVAIKMLLPHLIDQPDMRERFRREAQAMAGLDHPGILPVYEVGDHNGLPYFSMKLAAGGSLADQAPRFVGQWRAIAELAASLADAIHLAHSHGVLHRDLKPGNILFDEQGRAYLSDFGIAKQLAAPSYDHQLTKSATLLGTPNYLPPEWAAGTARRPTTAGDVYGLGTILYQLLTGSPPHQAAQLTTLLRQIADDSPAPPRGLNPQIPRDLEIICLKSIAKDPSDRYASAAALAADLRLWLAARPIRARPASLSEQCWRWSKRNPLPATLSALLAISLTFGGTALVHALRSSRLILRDSLVAQAVALRETGFLGHRAQAVHALEQACLLRPSRDIQREFTSALSMTDLHEDRSFNYGFGSRVHTDAALTRYAALNAQGHLQVCSLADNSLISAVGGTDQHPHSYGPFSPDGRFLCFRSQPGGPFSIWDCREHTLRLRDVAAPYMVFDPHQPQIALGKGANLVEVLDVLTGQTLATFTTDLQPARPYSFSPDGRHLIVGEAKASRFLVLETATGQTAMRGEHPPAARLRCAAWRPDGSGFFLGTESWKVYEWPLQQGSIPRQYLGHRDSVIALAVHPDGGSLLTQSDDGSTRLWNTASAQTVAQLPYSGTQIRFFPDGQRFLCEDRESHSAHILHLAASPICRQFTIPHLDSDRIGTPGCWAIAFSPDGGLLSVADTFGLLHFDGHSGQTRGQDPLGYCWSLGWDPDGSALYSVSNLGLQRWPRVPAPPTSPALGSPPSAWTLAPPTLWLQKPGTPPPHAANLNHLAVSAPGTTVAIAYDDHVSLLEAPSGHVRRNLGIMPALLDALALSRDGRLAAASQQKAAGVPLWDTSQGQLLRLLPTATAEASLRFHPDGQRLFTGDLQALTCWDVHSGKPLWRIPRPLRSSVPMHIALTPDGSLLAANLQADAVDLFRPADGSEITRLLHASPYAVASLAFSPDHSRLAVLCIGHLVQLWDLASLRRELAARSLDWTHPPQPSPQIPLSWQLGPSSAMKQ